MLLFVNDFVKLGCCNICIKVIFVIFKNFLEVKSVIFCLVICVNCFVIGKVVLNIIVCFWWIFLNINIRMVWNNIFLFLKWLYMVCFEVFVKFVIWFIFVCLIFCWKNNVLVVFKIFNCFFCDNFMDFFDKGY